MTSLRHAINAAPARLRSVYYQQEGAGHIRGSPHSPTRPPSVRRRQSLQIIDLEAKLERLAAENRHLQAARSEAERTVADAAHERSVEVSQLQEALVGLREDVARLRELNENLTATNAEMIASHEARYTALQAEHLDSQRQWDHSRRELDELRRHNEELSGQVESMVRQEMAAALEERTEKIDRLHKELEETREQVRTLQREILESKAKQEEESEGHGFLVIRDEDYFEAACQRLCQHIQQWVLRFSKFSDMRGCRLVEEVRDDRIVDRLETAVLDGSDVNVYLNDRIKRRDVFMSVVMAMVSEFIFTRYLFGMDREQRQKLKTLEKTLAEVGPASAVQQWRAITLTLLSRRPAFETQRGYDTEAVVQEIYHTLAAILPPPVERQGQIQESLRQVMRTAVDLSIEMRTQRAEYMMLPPLQPDYDINGEVARKVYFNAALMNDRSGGGSSSGRPTTTATTDNSKIYSNEELEAKNATVRMVLFPLVVKRGDDSGFGDEEIVVCPAQVIVTPLEVDEKDREAIEAYDGSSSRSRMTTTTTMMMETDDHRSISAAAADMSTISQAHTTSG